MFTTLSTLRDAAATYARYRKTRNEIAKLPIDVALDLGLFKEDAARIAHTAVYGQPR